MEKPATVINLESILIAPLQAKNELRGVFSSEPNPDYTHLVNWLKTQAWIAQREKKSRTYLIRHESVIIGYIAVATIAIEFIIPGSENQSRNDPQGVLLGKLFIADQCRGQGVGNIAMAFTLDLARKINELTGCAGIIVHSHPSSVGFYEKLGFVHIEGDENERTMFFKLS